MITQKRYFHSTFASSLNLFVMSRTKYHNSAMEYAMWYQEHLLNMEDVLGRKVEEKICELLDKKFYDYMEKKRNIIK